MIVTTKKRYRAVRQAAGRQTSKCDDTHKRGVFISKRGASCGRNAHLMLQQKPDDLSVPPPCRPMQGACMLVAECIRPV